MPAPPQKGALAHVTAEWVQSVADAAAADPAKTLSRTRRQSVEPFARYKGTSVWKRNHGGTGRAEFAKALASAR